MTIQELLSNGIALKNAGFSKDENVKAWIELTGSHKKVNAESQINN